MTNILITGATGFLGWEIVKELLKEKDTELYLLSRGKKERSAEDRIVDLVRKNYAPAKRKNILDRIEIIEGDVTEPNLGISTTKLDKLYGLINVIYHSAALCEFRIPLKVIRKINVNGTKNALDFALKCKNKGDFKAFHHISTVAIAGKTRGVFRESYLDIGQEFNNTYERTKFEAEKLVEKYRKKGLDTSVYRPSVITGNSITGEAIAFQMLYQPLHIFSLELFDKIPANRTLEYNLVPVDYVARAVCLISRSENKNKNYHITNTNSITLDFLLDTASSYFGFKKPGIIQEEQFDYKTLNGYKKKLIEPYLPYMNHKRLVFDTVNFKRALESKRFSWPVVDKKLLLKLFKYYADIKYIERKGSKKRRSL